ncbi:MAG TPA: DUF1080 domain-containing protein [Candidatus Anammoximicrobium sp.]|nr:DUF1080 domain-containing protein [Candidatus Anammoximicrobium sp.]
MKRLNVARLISFAMASVLLTGLAAAEDKKADWKPLMDGKTLAGWHPVGDGKWTVEDGAFVGRANNEKLYGLLVSDKMFRDFTVRFKFKCLSGDSGFYVRTIIKEPEKANGLQVQVGRIKSGVGGIYESYGRGWVSKPSDELEKSYTKDDQWNEMVIEAHGGSVVVTVNGIKSAEFKDDASRPEGHFALQMHAGCVMHVMFKDIEICEAAK